MKIVERSTEIGTVTAPGPLNFQSERGTEKTAFTNPKIHPVHRTRLAIVYVRQSSPQQVLNNRESRERQYALADRAVALGWPRERVLIVDDDQATSATTVVNRDGFHRVISELTMNHVGLLLGIDMSRVARNNKDWHSLLELCAAYDTVLADEDGVYDANDSNDRLLLGLKGAISEYELVTMRNRLERARINKAQRGELFYSVPMGYVLLADDQVVLDPDEQAQSVVRLIFAKFTELGSVGALLRYLLQQEICLPVRSHSGLNKGQLEWRRPQRQKLYDTLHHPLYAGAYAHGRRGVQRKQTASGVRHTTVRREREDWKVFLKDRWPSYITWEQYLKNQEQLRQNCSSLEATGTPRCGVALLPRLLVCGTCDHRMAVHYPQQSHAQYACRREAADGTSPLCCGLAARVIDDLVAQQVLRALEPASLELSLQSQSDLELERSRLHKHWDQTLRRARYEADVAGRRYKDVDSANRLVAATLEQSWEAALRNVQQLQEDYDRFQRQTPRQLSADEKVQITEAAADIRDLWSLTSTTNFDRQSLVRCLVERVVVHVRANSEHCDATIHWAGGYTSQHAVIRPVKTYSQMRDFRELLHRLGEMWRADLTAGQIAKQLNTEGFRPARGSRFTPGQVRRLLIRRGLNGNERSPSQVLGKNEWWLPDLARQLETTSGKLLDWARRGWVSSRRTSVRKHWIVWADDDELIRLRRLLGHSQRGVNAYPAELTTPKSRSRRS
jgi:DNA invertase Pin-like site-specific DNA recombinase